MVDRSELWLGRHVAVRLCGGETVGAVVDGLCHDWVGVRLDQGGYVISDWEDIEVDEKEEVVHTEQGEVLARKSEEEIPNDLEEAARHSEILTYPMPEDGDIEKVFKAQEARVFHEIGFIAGAKWQAEHTPLPEDTVLFNKGVEEGKRLMMEEAVEGEVMDFSSNQPRPQVDVYVDPNKYCTGDKVRIIIVKED